MPMQVLVDFRGYRVVCMPLLPVKGNKSMIYGSDAGKLPILNGKQLTEAMAKRLQGADPKHLAKFLGGAAGELLAAVLLRAAGGGRGGWR